MRALLLCSVLPLLATLGVAQQQVSGSASSGAYFLSAVELGSGGEASSPLYTLFPSQGTGLVAQPQSQSATYVMQGGFPATLTASLIGRPWMTAVRPFYVPQLGNPTLDLHGTQMSLGAVPTVTIGGQAASVVSRTVDKIVVTMPDQPVPGFQPVEVTNGLGTTALEEGVGVLPMFELREPMNGTCPNNIRFHGTAGDLVIFAMATEPAQTPFVLPGYGYALLLNQPDIVLSTLFLPNAEGRFDVPLPPFPPGILRVQALVLSNAPGYAPGSWTNELVL